MAQITEAEAIAELLHMVAAAEREEIQISQRLAAEREEYKREPSDDTLWIINRQDKRLAAARKRLLVLRFCLAKLQE
jgi:hypothetical protein